MGFMESWPWARGPPVLLGSLISGTERRKSCMLSRWVLSSFFLSLGWASLWLRSVRTIASGRLHGVYMWCPADAIGGCSRWSEGQREVAAVQIWVPCPCHPLHGRSIVPTIFRLTTSNQHLTDVMSTGIPCSPKQGVRTRLRQETHLRILHRECAASAEYRRDRRSHARQ